MGTGGTRYLVSPFGVDRLGNRDQRCPENLKKTSVSSVRALFLLRLGWTTFLKKFLAGVLNLSSCSSDT
jgi:hypothetical protein